MFGSPASSSAESSDGDEEEEAVNYSNKDREAVDNSEDSEEEASASATGDDDDEDFEQDEEEPDAELSTGEEQASDDSDSASTEDEQNADESVRTRPGLAQDCQIYVRRLVKKGVPYTTMHRVDPPRLIHKDWCSFTKYLERYSSRTHQAIPIKEPMNWIEKNKRIQDTAAVRRGTASLIPESWYFYQKTFICTHGWEREPRGDSVRPRQFVNSTSCPFRFVVQMQPSKKLSAKKKRVKMRSSDGIKVSSSRAWYLRVTSGFFGHNHPVTSDTYDTYPVARGVVGTSTAAEVSTLITAKSARTLIYDLCLERGENVYKRDIDNLVQKQRALALPVNEDEATAAVLTEFASPLGNSVSVAENQSGETGVISMTSAHMRATHSRFYEPLLLDTTHKTNRHNYQILTFMNTDEYGEGRVVQHSLVETNSDWHMHMALDHFFETHEKNKLVRVIVVDKDLNEIRLLKERFPEARILICTFHVIKYLWEKCHKFEYGKHSQENLEQIDAFVHKMVYAESAEEYEASLEAFRGLCTRMGNDAFVRYFETNWNTEDCKDMWVYYRRARLPHFRNHTNNRLESFFGKLKNTLKPDFSMPECLRKIIAHGKRVENEYKLVRSRQGHAVNQNYDKEMRAVLRLTTHWVSECIEPEYAAGLAKANSERRLSGLEVHHDEFSQRKPKFATQKNPRLNSEAFYLLPESLLEACVKVLPVRNTALDAISLIEGECVGDSDSDTPVDFVTIKDLGAYSRQQIQAMAYLAGLKAKVESCKGLCRWFIETVVPVVDEATGKIVKEVEAHIRVQYPSRIVPRLGDHPGYCYSMLYRVQPPEYLNDPIIDAACQRFSNEFPYVRHAGTPDARPGGARTNKQKVPRSMQDKVKAFVASGDVDIVLVPVNFGNSHWCGILVDLQMKDIIYYDSLNSDHYLPTLKTMAMSLKNELSGFIVQHIKVPVQFDGYSCGIYVCYFFFNYVLSKEKSLSKAALDVRRWELLYYVLYGHTRHPAPAPTKR